VLPGQVYSYKITSISGGVESAESLDIVSPPVPFPPTPVVVNLGTASSFEVLAGSTVTNTGTSTAHGDVGVSPGTSITGFGPPSAITGVFHVADFVAAGAQSAISAAYIDAQSRTGAITISGDIGGQTLAPGVYNSASTIGITGVLYLDAGGNPNATWVFQIGSALTTAAGNSAVFVVNGGRASNVFWQVGSSATLNTNTRFAGTIMAQASITVGSAVTVDGRLLARTGAVTLIGDTLTQSISATLGVYGSNQLTPVGGIIFDNASSSYQEAMVGGTTGPTRPTFSAVIGTMTPDGTVTWITMDPTQVSVVAPPPPSPPNVAPPAPAAPTNPRIASEA
jgi:hypothetical protein